MLANCEDTFEEEDPDDEAEMITLNWYHWGIVAALDILGPFASDAYTPNTPEIRKTLHTTNVMTGLTLQLNWLSKGLATLWIGALSDMPQCGRLGAIYRTFGVFIIGAVGSFLTPTTSYGIYCFLAFRVVEGLGESATTVCSAIARDVIEEEQERVKILTLISSLQLVAFALAPTLGGLVGDLFGWRVLFLALAVVALILWFMTVLSLPETLAGARELAKKKKNKRTLFSSLFSGQRRRRRRRIKQQESSLGRPLLDDNDNVEEENDAKSGNEATKDSASNFGPVLRRLFVLTSDRSTEMGKARASLLMIVFGVSGFYIFFADISPLLQDEFGVSVVNTALLIGSSAMVEVSVNAALAYCFYAYKGAWWLESEFLLKLCLIFTFISSVSAAICAFGPWPFLRESWLYLMLNQYWFAFALSFGFGPANTLFIQPFPDDAGKAAAVLLIARTAFGTGLSQVSIDLMDAYGLKGYYGFFSLVTLLSQVAWFFLLPPRTTTSDDDIQRKLENEVDVSSDEELREQLLPWNADDSTVAPESTVADSDIGDDLSSIDGGSFRAVNVKESE